MLNASEELALTLLLSMLSYLPHVCLQQLLWSLDRSDTIHTTLAWASAMVAVRVVNLLVRVYNTHL